MKKLLLSLLVLSAAMLSFFQPTNELTKKERDDAAQYFTETKTFLAQQIKGLSEAQLKWKPADSVWSIANCVEHIAITETGIYEWGMQVLKIPVDPGVDLSKKPTDEDVKTKVADRSSKAQAPEMFKPTGKFGNTAQAYNAFEKKRDSLIQYITTTKDNLRGHYDQSFFGPTDVYQILLLLSGHTKRHTLQIVEIKTMPGFPVK